MKTPIRLLLALIAGFGWISAGRVTAQIFTTLHSFSGGDGANPVAGLIISGNTLYGTTFAGGSFGKGTVFAVNTDGTGFTNIHNFAGSDGANPQAGLILFGNTLYGTSLSGGDSGRGVVFAINPDGTGFTSLHSFTGGSDGGDPIAGLVVLDNVLYGTTVAGGSFGKGTVFAINIDATSFKKLHSFAGSDGAHSYGGLIIFSNYLYGTTTFGGSSGVGTVFGVNFDGTSFKKLHSFAGSDGALPFAMVLSGDTLYGTTVDGSSGSGSVFRIKTDGTSFTNLHNFTATLGPSYTNSDGSKSYGRLILSGNRLYGTARNGGTSGQGTVYAVNTDGTGFMTLYDFTDTSGSLSTNSDGAWPYGGLVLSGDTLFGTSYLGGSSGNGTVFSLSFAPQLTIIPSATNFILSWPTSYAGFDYTGFTLQSSHASAGPFTNIPGATSPYTNPISGGQQFFRLISN